MANPATPPDVLTPLSDFQPIGKGIFVYTSATYTPKEPLILLFTWMGALPKHIAKYTLSYRRLFPSAKILLIRCELADVFKKSPILQPQLQPAFSLAEQHVNAGGELLVHSFSNGGGTLLVEFAKMWVKRRGAALPMRAQVVDSAPGKGGWRRSYAAISVSLPRNGFTRVFGGLAVWMFLFSVFVWNGLLRRENAMLVMTRLLNDAGLFDVRAPRVYLYSKADAMVGYEEVEEHAALAREAGRTVVPVCFEKSPHAGHIREDEGKYWGAVMKAWNREVEQ